MTRSRSWFGLCAFAVGVSGLACSHEQKAPPAHPDPAPVAVRRAAPPPPPPEVAQAPEPRRKDEPSIYFDFDSALLRPESHDVLQKVAANVRGSDRTKVRIEGNCDEVGTVEYNLALGEHRAIQAKDYLTKLGIPSGHIKTVSYGSQHPKAPGHDDEAHAETRRDDFILR